MQPKARIKGKDSKETSNFKDQGLVGIDFYKAKSLFFKPNKNFYAVYLADFVLRAYDFKKNLI